MATPNTRRLASLATAADMIDVSTKTIHRYIAYAVIKGRRRTWAPGSASKTSPARA